MLYFSAAYFAYVNTPTKKKKTPSAPGFIFVFISRNEQTRENIEPSQTNCARERNCHKFSSKHSAFFFCFVSSCALDVVFGKFSNQLLGNSNRVTGGGGRSFQSKHKIKYSSSLCWVGASKGEEEVKSSSKHGNKLERK